MSVMRIILASVLLLLSACGTTPIREPVHAIATPVLPPPPYVPYESHPGEAANVAKVTDSISNHSHVEAPHIKPANRSKYKNRPEYPANVIFINNTNCTLGIYLKGATPREFGISAGQTSEADIAAGSYIFSVTTNLCPGIPPPLQQTEFLVAGNSYTLTLSQIDILPKVGNLVIYNNTGTSLRASIDGNSYSVADGQSSTIELMEGSHTTTVSAQCGTKQEALNIVRGSTVSESYWCVEGGISTERPQIGSFVINNETGEQVTVVVGGKSYSVSSGTKSIELQAGNYTASIKSRCGSVDQNITITHGSQSIGTYQCRTVHR